MNDTGFPVHREELIKRWRRCHSFVLFFTDFPVWLGTNPPAEKLLEEYDALFKGARFPAQGAAIPLWASACAGDGLLLDRTTLECIKIYHTWGYASVPMDGNPPDFIGQQFRFLCYLHACALHDLEKSGTAGAEYAEAAKKFADTFLRKTTQKVTAGIRINTKFPLFLDFADELEAEGSKGDTVDLPLPELYCYEFYVNGRNPARQTKPERIINTAGRNNCGGKCAVRAREQEGCLLEISADCGLVGEPVIRACLRGRFYRETYMNSERLRYPLQRVGERGEGRFRRISWEDAADITAAEWIRIRDTRGPGSRYVNDASGVSAVLRPDVLVRRLLNLDGGHLSYYNSYSSACVQFTTPYIYGDNFSGNSFVDILNTKLLILWGHNPQETVFGSGRNYYLAKAREKGIRIVVIDPRESDSVRSFGAEWIGIRPSSDAALADGMAYTIWSLGLQDQHFMDTFCLGFDEAHLPPGIPAGNSYETYLFGKKDGIPKTPEWAAGITGIPAATIEKLARDYALAKPACIMPGYGVQRTGNGEANVRTIALLTCLTGNVGISGGGAAGTGDVKGPAFRGYPILPNPFPAKIPVFLWTRAVEHGTEMNPRDDGLLGAEKLDTNIKMLFNLAGNTLVNQHSDINNTIRILKDTGKCEFILCSDVFMTPSARFADILLPAPSFLEDDNIAPPWDFGNYLLFNNQVIDPLFGCRREYEFLESLARRLGLWEAWSGGAGDYAAQLEGIYQSNRKAIPELPEYSAFKEAGGYHLKNAPPYIAYREQREDFAHHPFNTPSGKIEIFSQRLYDLGRPGEVPPIPGYVPCPEGPEDPLAEKYPLQLIGWHTKRRTHSIHDNNPRLEAADPQRLWMNPRDAEVRNIQEGALAEVFNDRGRICMPVHITRRIIPGVAAMSQGAWYTPDADGTDRRGSINVLSSQRPTPLARGNPQHTNLVEVRKSELTSP